MPMTNYLHRQAPVYSLCLYRAALGLLIVYDALTWLFHTTELFSNQGFHIPNVWSVPHPTPALAFGLCLLLVLSGLMVAAGLFTRVAIFCTLAIWGYFYCLDSINEKAAWTIVMIVLTALFFSDCGNRFSLDHWLRRRAKLPEAPETSSIFVQRLLQLEFMQIYFFCGISKITNPDWVNGSIFYRLMNCRWATDLGIWASTLDLNIPARMGGLGTILFELFVGVFLFFPSTRRWAIAVGVCFHLGIQATLSIGTLGFYFMTALLILFPEPETIAGQMKKALGRF